VARRAFAHDPVNKLTARKPDRDDPWMRIWKFLHIASMFTGVTLLFGADLLFRRAAAARDVLSMRKIGEWSKPMVAGGVIATLLGILFGFITAIVGSFDLTRAWLILAYVLVGLIVVLGLVESPYQKQLEQAAARSPDGVLSPELEALLTDPRRHLTAVSALLYVAVIFDMVVKPI
jgi:hypothetical protein